MMKIQATEVQFSNIMGENAQLDQLLQAGCSTSGGCEMPMNDPEKDKE